MVNAAYAIIALPLAGFVVNLVWGRRLGEPLAGWVGTFAAAGLFVATLVVWGLGRHPPVLDRLHAPGPWVRPVLRLPQPV